VRNWTGFFCLRILSLIPCCEYNNKLSSSTKGRVFLKYLSNYRLLKVYLAPHLAFSVRQHSTARQQKGLKALILKGSDDGVLYLL
jgi:hypothetical protein